MKFQFWTVGKQHEAYVQQGIDLFTKRISNYFPVEWNIIPMPKNAGTMTAADIVGKEGEIIVNLLKKEDYLVALEEKGKQLNSESFAAFIQQRANESQKKIIFLIGGAYGLSGDVLSRADFQWSLSSLVFPHQLVRLILVEQVYRACSILKNEKYHHS